MNSIMQAMVEPLGPKQLGYDISRGVEAAVHATWIYVHNLQPHAAPHPKVGLSECLQLPARGHDAHDS